MVKKVEANIQSLVALRHLKNANKNVADSLRRISSGKRVMSAGDDAASLSLSLKSELIRLACVGFMPLLMI